MCLPLAPFLFFALFGGGGRQEQTVTEQNVSMLAVVEMIHSFRPIDQPSSQTQLM